MLQAVRSALRCSSTARRALQLSACMPRATGENGPLCETRPVCTKCVLTYLLTVHLLMCCHAITLASTVCTPGVLTILVTGCALGSVGYLSGVPHLAGCEAVEGKRGGWVSRGDSSGSKCTYSHVY